MKLRNKKTGEIIEVKSVQFYYENEDGHEYQWSKRKDGITIAELNEEWEDYEEPKVNYYISADANIRKSFEFDSDRNSIGNSFLTLEEAKKAVEKLKAWKRLKDKRFERVFSLELSDALCGGKTAEFKLLIDDKDSIEDIKLLFGVEE